MSDALKIAAATAAAALVLVVANELLNRLWPVQQ